MNKFMFFSFVGLLFCIQASAASPCGEYNQQVDAALFQQKCASCHSVGLIMTSDEVLPSEVWCLVKRMARTDGANMYCHDENCRIYTYIVNMIARARTDELERALLCVTPERRQCEEQALEQAKNRYQ